MKSRETETVAGITVEKSLARNTRCAYCGRKFFTGEDFIKTHTPTESVAYVHRTCVEHRRYGSDIQDVEIVTGKTTGARLRWAVEIEAMYKGSAHFYDEKREDVDAFLAASCKLQPSNDCTVDVEYHMANRFNLHGVKDFWTLVSSAVNLDHSNCGHHINMSKTDWSCYDIDKINWNTSELFTPLMNHLLEDPDKTVEVWGRYFGEYCDLTFSGHYAWLHCNEGRIEFRLPHFKNPTQFTWLLFLCKDIVDILDKFVKGDIDEQVASKKILDLEIKHENGRANYQRPERNNR